MTSTELLALLQQKKDEKEAERIRKLNAPILRAEKRERKALALEEAKSEKRERKAMAHAEREERKGRLDAVVAELRRKKAEVKAQKEAEEEAKRKEVGETSAQIPVEAKGAEEAVTALVSVPKQGGEKGRKATSEKRERKRRGEKSRMRARKGQWASLEWRAERWRPTRERGERTQREDSNAKPRRTRKRTHTHTTRGPRVELCWRAEGREQTSLST